MTSPAIQLARECGDVETDRRGRETYTFDNHGIERLIARAQAQALRDAADKMEAMGYVDSVAELRRMAEELEASCK